MRKLSIAIASLGLVAGVGAGTAHAADKYPAKPIMCIVGVEAGADGDVLVRPIMQSVSKMLGQPVVIVNKPGGGSSIAYREIHAAKPDGYTSAGARRPSSPTSCRASRRSTITTSPTSALTPPSFPS